MYITGKLINLANYHFKVIAKNSRETTHLDEASDVLHCQSKHLKGSDNGEQLNYCRLLL